MLILRPIWSVIVIQNLNYSLSYIHWFLKILGKLRRFSRYDDEISEGQLGINEKELNSMNKHIPGKNFELYFACSKNKYFQQYYICNNIMYFSILNFFSIKKSWKICHLSTALLPRRRMGVGHYLLLLHGQYLYYGSSDELWNHTARNSYSLSKEWTNTIHFQSRCW